MKTTEHASTPSAPDHLPKGDSALNKAVMGAHQIIDKATNNAAENIVHKAAPTFDRTVELAHQALHNAAAAAAPASDWLSEQAVDLNATQKKLVEDARKYVAANPLTSLGIALAAGFLISRMFR